MHVHFRRLFIMIVPLTLAILESFHLSTANGHVAYLMLHLRVGWWIALQVLQIALFCLSTLLVFRLTIGRQGTFATLSRVGLLLFLSCAVAYAGLIGIGTGMLVAHADALVLAARVCFGLQASIVRAITTYSANPIGTGLLVLACLGWIVGALSALLAFSTKSDPDAMALALQVLHADG